jgi:hypothetical protein
MPFRVKFFIYDNKHTAPVYTTFDKCMARVEYNDRNKKDPWTRLEFTVEQIDLTNHEKYVWLVYEVRKAIHKYYNCGRKHEDLQDSLDKEAKLDQWNARTRIYLNNHPKCQVDEKAKSFFLLVDAWRDKWHKYFSCKKAHAVEQAVLDQMKKECFEYEKQIDKYVKQVIGLI